MGKRSGDDKKPELKADSNDLLCRTELTTAVLNTCCDRHMSASVWDPEARSHNYLEMSKKGGRCLLGRILKA
jgi:hypothetical protein